MFKRYILINFILKDGPVEYSSAKGCVLGFFNSLKPWEEIKKDCIAGLSDEDKLNYNFNYFRINSITYVKKKDYISFFNANAN